jgi:Head domain of trimeric autotransporter adhesin/Chaperone of endosialidase
MRTSFIQSAGIICLFLFLAASIKAQSLSVNTDGSAADNSAMLDIKSINKGLLIPRQTLAERGSIVLPATGLIIFQTDNTPGYYYNAGTTALPNWLRLVNTIDNYWTNNGTNIYNTNAGNVGIGTTVPRAPLSFSTAVGQKISLWDDGNVGGDNYGIGIQGGLLQIHTYTINDDIVLGYGSSASLIERMRIKGNGNVGIGNIDPAFRLDITGRMRIRTGFDGEAGIWLNNNANTAVQAFAGLENDNYVGLYGAAGAGWSFGMNTGNGDVKMMGRVGIGTTTFNAPLNFPASLGKKIILYPGATGDVGMSVQGNLLQIYADHPNADIAFGYDQAGTMTERMRIKATGNVGIGTNNPLAKLHVFENSVVFTMAGNVIGAGPTPVTGEGRRMMWYADKAAFRVGYVDNGAWDAANIGDYSFATGYRAAASGAASVAMGLASIASGNHSFAFGPNATASGVGAIAIGSNTVASGDNSFATGSTATATGARSVAMGNGIASNQSAVALGEGAASGVNSFAVGIIATASGNFSTALGSRVSTNSNAGSMIMGDGSGITTHSNDAANQVMMRFAGGYKFYTNAALSIGTQLISGANAWSVMSDINRKENFDQVDGESVLENISRFNLGTWNYKGQDPALYRHYGPMAQEFFDAFGKDSYGLIGNDSTINQADFDGINLIAIQALEKRTTENTRAVKEIANLRSELITRDTEFQLLKNEVEELKKIILAGNKN